MLKLLKPFLSLRFIKFCTVGASGVVVNLGSLWLLADILGLHANLAAAAAIEISINTNFLVNELWTFRDRRRDGSVARRLFKFHLVSLVGAGLQWAVFVIMNLVLASTLELPQAQVAAPAGEASCMLVDGILNPPEVGGWKYLSQLCGIAVATVWNFTANFYWTWRNKEVDGDR